MFYKYPFIRYPPRRCSFWPCGPVDPACEEDPFQALASPDDLEEMGDQPPPPNTARLLDGTDQRSEVFFGWGGWKTCFKRWNMWGWRWIFRNAYMYMHTYDICSLCTTTFVFAFFCEGIVSNKWFVILRGWIPRGNPMVLLCTLGLIWKPFQNGEASVFLWRQTTDIKQQQFGGKHFDF